VAAEIIWKETLQNQLEPEHELYDPVNSYPELDSLGDYWFLEVENGGVSSTLSSDTCVSEPDASGVERTTSKYAQLYIYTARKLLKSAKNRFYVGDQWFLEFRRRQDGASTYIESSLLFWAKVKGNDRH